MKRTLSRILSLVTALVLSLAALPAAALADGAALSVVTYTSDPTGFVMLYAAPSVSAEQIGCYYNGTDAQVLYTTSTGWSQVQIGSTYGYVKTANLLDASLKTAIDARPQYKAVSSAWQLWNSPSYTAAYEMYGYGVEVRLMGSVNGWWHVEIQPEQPQYLGYTVTGFVPGNNTQFQLVSGNYTAGYATAVVKNPNPNDRLNLRAEPTSKSASLGKYYNGTTVAILDKQSDWYKVQVGNTTGWMSSSYLDVSASQHSVKDVRPTLTVLGNNTELFYDCSDSSGIVTTFSAGTKLTVLGVCSSWYHVEHNGEYGFVRISDMSAGDVYVFETETTKVVRPGWQVRNHGEIRTAEWPINHDKDGDGQFDYLVAIVNNPNPSDRLHLREEPSSKSDSAGKYNNGVQGKVLEQRDGWVHVSINGLDGWMDARYLILTTNPAEVPATTNLLVLTVSNPNPGAKLNLRYGKSTSTPTNGAYPNGTKVIVLGFDSTWAHVYVDGLTGYMLAHYLQE